MPDRAAALDRSQGGKYRFCRFRQSFRLGMVDAYLNGCVDRWSLSKYTGNNLGFRKVFPGIGLDPLDQFTVP